jgi:hypothetical protein
MDYKISMCTINSIYSDTSETLMSVNIGYKNS